MSEGNGNGNNVLSSTIAVGGPLRESSTSLHVSEATVVSRERQYNAGDDIGYLLGLFRNQRLTGQLVINLSQGSVCDIRFKETQKITP